MTNGPIQLFSGLALKQVLTECVLPAFTERTGQVVAATFEPTGVLVDLIAAGRRPDVMIGVDGSLRELTLGTSPVLSESSLRPLVRSGIGVAVRAGSPAPTIGTVDEFKQALLGTERVAYSRTGASGVYFAELLVTLGIAHAVNGRACVIDKGFVGETLLDGRADLAVQQLVELATVDGIRIVGPLPDAVQRHIELSAAAAAGAVPVAADSLLEFLRSPKAGGAYPAVGLEPTFEVPHE